MGFSWCAARPCGSGRRRPAVASGHAPARREPEPTAGQDTSITAAERQKIEQQKERAAQLARQEEAQIDAFVRGVLGEKMGEKALRRERLKPKNEGLQGKTPEAGCIVM